MSNKQQGTAAVVLLSGLVVVAMAVVAGVVVLKQRQNAASQPPAATANSQETALDKVKRARLYDLINAISVTYTTQRKPYPPGTAEGWGDVIDTIPISEAYIDPYTDTLYTFTSEEPGVGQISYGLGVECDSERQNFVPSTSDRIIAVRAKFSDGVRCMSNIQG